MGRRPLGDLSVMLVTVLHSAMASNSTKPPEGQEVFWDMTGRRISPRMIEGYSANRPAVSTGERTESNSRLAPSAARVR